MNHREHASSNRHVGPGWYADTNKPGKKMVKRWERWKTLFGVSVDSEVPKRLLNLLLYRPPANR